MLDSESTCSRLWSRGVLYVYVCVYMTLCAYACVYVCICCHVSHRLGVPSLGPGFEFCVEDCLLLQELQGVVDAQAGLTQPTLQGEEGGTDFTALNGNVEFAMFVAAKRRSPHILFSTRAVQTYLRGAMFGLKYWRKREKRLRHTAPVVLQDPTCPSTTALVRHSPTVPPRVML